MMKGLTIQQSHPLVDENMSNLTSASGEASVSSSTNRNDNGIMYPSQYFPPTTDQSQSQPQPQPVKKKRNQPGNPDPGAEVIALSPRTLLATNRFVCEICNKGFQREQNLQLHRRGHNLPWKLKQRTSKEVRKKVYVCPETTCVHHDPSRALGDLTGIKKHFCRKHGEKKWKCEKCSKKYAVRSDWKAHSKTCGTREYRCDCGTLFSRRDSFITHRAFCDALTEESAKTITGNNIQIITSQANFSTSHVNLQVSPQFNAHNFPYPIKKEQQIFSSRPEIPLWLASCPPAPQGPGPTSGSGPPLLDLTPSIFHPRLDQAFSQYDQEFSQNQNPNPNIGHGPPTPPPYNPAAFPHISATSLLQKAVQMGATTSPCPSPAAMPIRPHQDHMFATDSAYSTTGFGLNLSSREKMFSGFINGLALYGNKAALKGCTDRCAPPAGDSSTSGPSLLHDTTMNNPGFEGSTFEDAFGGIFNSLKKDENFHAAHHHFSTNESGGIDGTTRDFLGLKPISHGGILSITGLDHNCNDASYEDRNEYENPKSWQD